MSRRVSRREVLGSIGVASLGAFVAACGGGGTSTSLSAVNEIVETVTAPSPTPSPTPEPPFIVAAGEEKRLLMTGTAQETPYYIFGSGQPGPVLMVLGGVHGNEPGGWMAAERLVDKIRPSTGALIVAPRANKIAITSFVRTTDDLGDLNRLYPGSQDGLPMARMAGQLVDVMREFRVSYVIDMHESWAFYNDRPQNGTAFLGQTVGSNVSDVAVPLAESVVSAVNSRILAPHEEFFYRNRVGSGGGPPDNSTQPDTAQGGIARPAGGSNSSSSSLGLPRWLPNLSIFLVEMGQQQSLERRVALHVDVATEMMRQINIA